MKRRYYSMNKMVLFLVLLLSSSVNASQTLPRDMSNNPSLKDSFAYTEKVSLLISENCGSPIFPIETENDCSTEEMTKEIKKLLTENKFNVAILKNSNEELEIGTYYVEAGLLTNRKEKTYILTFYEVLSSGEYKKVYSGEARSNHPESFPSYNRNEDF